MNTENRADLFPRALVAVIEQVGGCIEAAGVAVIAIGAMAATLVYLLAIRRRSASEAYAACRMGLGRFIFPFTGRVNRLHPAICIPGVSAGGSTAFSWFTLRAAVPGSDSVAGHCSFRFHRMKSNESVGVLYNGEAG